MRLQAIIFKTKIVEAALLFRAEKNFMRCVLSLRMPMESKGYIFFRILKNRPNIFCTEIHNMCE